MAALARAAPWALAPGTTEFDQTQPGEIGDDEVRPKRAKVVLACQRCKKRKQKCDGAYPCSKCQAHRLDCEYVVPQKPMPFGKNHYFESLERRVAELETLLAVHGIEELSDDHWRDGAPSAPIRAGDEANPGPSRADESASPPLPTQSPLADGLQEDSNPIFSILRSLSLDANGSDYIGASSHIALGKLFGFLGQNRPTAEPSSAKHPKPASDARLATPGSTAGRISEDPIELAELPSHIANRLFAGYLKHIATRFPVIHSVWARDLHTRRQSLVDAFERSTLHLIYAAAGRFIETTGESGDFGVKRHYRAANASLNTIMEHNDIRTVQTLMLMAIYCLRDPVGAGAWTYCRTALLIAIDHGLHRERKGQSHPRLKDELRKRLFWACYCFDRQISIPMGRPFGISDRDIDVEMPLDVNEDSAADCIERASTTLDGSSKSTTMTSFIWTIKLRMIESGIQQTVYRVDHNMPLEPAVAEHFLDRLAAWKDAIPSDTHHFKDVDAEPYDGYDFYLVFYYKCQRLLLYPFITRFDVEPRFLKECARACAGVCGAYKRLHQSLAVGYSTMAVQTVFMAGLTLAYCIWLSPDDVFDMTTSNGIHDCSVVLFVIAERVAAAKKYRNAFEAIRQRVIDHIQNPKPQLREALPSLTTELPPRRSASGSMTFDDESYEQISQIMADMAGEGWLSGDGNCSFNDAEALQDLDFDHVLGLSEL